MKRSPSSRRGRSLRDADRLIHFADGLARSGSRVEDRFWEAALDKELQTLLQQGDEGVIAVALDRLAESDAHAYEELADALENCVEHGAENDPALLFAAPILAWSRMQLPSGTLPAALLTQLRQALGEIVFASGVEISLTNFLWSPEQLPETFNETIELRESLEKSLEKGEHLSIDPKSLKEALPFLADVRYVVGAVKITPHAPVFRWQEAKIPRDEVLERWTTAMRSVLESTFQACAFEPQLPGAYYVSSREADQAARPFSVSASVVYLSTTLNVQAEDLLVTFGACYDRRLEEFRISFALSDGEVIHGVVWPLLGTEEEATESAEEIETVLKAAGVVRIGVLDQRLPMEYCDDCGSPLYPNQDGEMVHAEMPDQDVMAPVQMH